MSLPQFLREFQEIRKVSTPWCAIRTVDYMATIAKICALRKNVDDEAPKAGYWTCVGGIITPIRLNTNEKISKEVGPFGDSTKEDAPFALLDRVRKDMVEGGILFWVITDNGFFDSSATVQAISNLRDEFKSTNRCFVLLGNDPKLPPFLAEDIPILEDPLPTESEHRVMIESLAKDAKIDLDEEKLNKAAEMCLGLSPFAAEEAVARKLRKSTGVDFAGLAMAKQRVVEQSSGGALLYEKETWTFEQMGGVANFKDFMGSIFRGPKRPSIIVRVDEIDKSITAASAGTIADNTGVSQDILKTMLTGLEDNKWMGLFALGPPGTGKTLASICVGNEFGARTLVLDLGAVKGSLVGESEQKMRRVMNVIKTIGGEKVLFIATANRLDTIPPELIRRFWLGQWFWDMPTAAERELIWPIQRKRFNIPKDDPTPDDEGWTGSDIRNCCQMAWATKTPLKEASQWITLVGKTNKTNIEKLRVLAEEGGFRSAAQPGAYNRFAIKDTKKKIRT